MKINRKELLQLHNPVLSKMETDSPLTVGNGDFAFTADVTGLQTLYEEYMEPLPLCTMASWGWHTIPAENQKGFYTLDELEMTRYPYLGRMVAYPKKRFPGNEKVYDWLRMNPHKINLMTLGLTLDGSPIHGTQIENIHQMLDLYTGILTSQYTIDDSLCQVETLCAKNTDTLGISIESVLGKSNRMALVLRFPYASSGKSASDWNCPNRHTTSVDLLDSTTFRIFRRMDGDTYEIIFHAENPIRFVTETHKVIVQWNSGVMRCTLHFAKTAARAFHYESVKQDGVNGWSEFWERGAAVRLNHSKDSRAIELERRIVLSQYLMAVNSSGSTPPQETGLTCNSWYGKMHLEMYLWHCAWLPLWNHVEELKKSLNWYRNHQKEAQQNAEKNGFRGARWPKMIASEGIDCPSPVAPLLIWQQPHIIFILELTYQNIRKSKGDAISFLQEYWPLVSETAVFMEDFCVYNKEKDTYELLPPLIPVQECHGETLSTNPVFELEYWRCTLGIASQWAKRLGKTGNPYWEEIVDKLSTPASANGVYLAHDNCPDTFLEFNRDHPSMLGAFGLLNSQRVEEEMMRNTLNRVMDVWQYETLWGWDFALMAMTAVRLGEPEKAIDILMKDTFKNRYVRSGNNMQEGRSDLPLYLPGNGSILLAIPLMVEGWPGCRVKSPGFPKDGSWIVESDGLMPYFE